MLERSQPRFRRINEAEKLVLLEGILQDSGGGPESSQRQVDPRLTRLNRMVTFAQKHHLLEDQHLRNRYQQWGIAIGPDEEKLFDCYSRYQQLLRTRRTEDADGSCARLYESLLTGSIEPKSIVPGLQLLAFEGFYNLTPVQLGVLRMLSSEVREVHFSVDWDSAERDLDRFSYVLRDMVDFWQHLEVEWVFHPGRKETARVYFSEPETEQAEVRILAGRISEARSEGPDLRFSEIGVICSSVGRYESHIQEAFSARAIPFVVCSGGLSPQTYASRLLLDYVQLLQSDFHRSRLFDLLSSPWIEVEGLELAQIRLLEKSALRAGIVQGLCQWTDGFTDWIARDVRELRKEGRDADAASLQASAVPFRILVEQLSLDIDTGRTLARWLHELSQRLARFSKLPVASESWIQQENLTLRAYQNNCWSMALAWESRPLSLDRLKRELSRLLSRPSRLTERDSEGVSVGAVEDFQQCDFRMVYWLGFAEGQFPSPSRDITPVSLRGDDQEVSRSVRRLEEDLHLFHGISLRTAEAIYFSSPRRVGASQSRPSPFLRYLKVQRIEAERTLGLNITSETDQVQERLDNIRRGLEVQAQRESVHLSPYEGVFANDRAISDLRQRFYSKGIGVSPSRLEDYVECGFRYFARRLLKVRAPESGDVGVPAREIGRSLHQIFCRFFQRVLDTQDGGQRLSLEDEKGLMLAIGAEELELLGIRYQRTRDVVWQDQVEKLLRGLKRGGKGLLASFLEQRAERPEDAEVHAVEQPFSLVLGQVGSSPAVPVLLTGTIDRIDSSQSGYSIVDYKTGEATPLRKLRGGWGFQLPLYLVGAESMLNEKVQEAAFHFVSLPLTLEQKPLSAFVEQYMPEESLNHLVDGYSRKAVEAAAQLYRGHFPVTLLGPRAAGCRRCAYSRVCRIDLSKMQRARVRDSVFPAPILTPSSHRAEE